MKIQRGIKESGEKFVSVDEDGEIRFVNGNRKNLERAIAKITKTNHSRVDLDEDCDGEVVMIYYGDNKFVASIEQINLFDSPRDEVKAYFAFLTEEFEKWKGNLPYTEEFEV